MTTIDSHGNKHRGSGAPGAGQFDGKVNTSPAGTLTDLAAELDTSSSGSVQHYIETGRYLTHAEVAEQHALDYDPDAAGCDSCGMHDRVPGTRLCEGCASQHRTIGGGQLEQISAAQARRELPIGQRVQVVYLGGQRPDDDGTPILRSVAKQTPHDMITSDGAGGRGSHLDWAHKSAQRDENGALIISGADGLPFVAYIPLDDDSDAIANPQVQLRVTSDHQIAKETDSPAVLDLLAGSQVPGIRAAVARNPNTPTDALTLIAQTASDERTLEAIAEHPNADRHTMDHLAESEQRSVRYAAAASEKTDAHTLRGLAGDDSDGVRAGVGRNMNTPTEILDRLATARSSEVRQAVASNPRTSPEVLDKLSRTDGFSMAQVGKNTSATPETLRRLADDTSTGNQTRAMVASNPAAPRDIIARSVRDADAWVREHAASNRNLTVEERAHLAMDPSTRVRRAIARNPQAAGVTALAEDSDAFVRSSYAKNPALTPDMLARLADDDFHAVRTAVAGNPNTPVPVLQRLAAGEGAGAATAQKTLASLA